MHHKEPQFSQMKIKGTYKVSQILNVIKENLATHWKEYDQAMQNFELQKAQKFAKLDKDWKKFKQQSIDYETMLSSMYDWNRFIMSKPVDATKSYQDMYNLFENITTEDIELDWNDANVIFNDTWDFAISAKTINSAYVNS